MNTDKFYRVILSMALLSFMGSYTGQAVEKSGSLEGDEIIEIEAREIRKTEEPVVPVQPEITPIEKPGLPEAPKPITRTELNDAEKHQLSQLELDYAQGKITKTEYDMKKDGLYREANITF